MECDHVKQKVIFALGLKKTNLSGNSQEKEQKFNLSEKETDFSVELMFFYAFISYKTSHDPLD